MLISHIYREKLGTPIKTCMACAATLNATLESTYGLCQTHWTELIKPPDQLKRNFGKGIEYQLLRHSDELDDILFRLEYDWEPGWPLRTEQLSKPDYLIYAHYIAKIFLYLLCRLFDLNTFDYITFANSCYTAMEFVFPEMGYLAGANGYAKLLLSDELHNRMQEEKLLPETKNKRILLLDLYRSYDTRDCIDRLKLSGASEIITVYLTSYS